MRIFPNAFNEDLILQQTFTALVEKHKPSVLLETGTHKADTTEYLCEFGVPVISTEINQSFFTLSQNKLKNVENVTLLLGDSAEVLTKNINLIKNEKVLAFLDSHFLNDQVLERELELLGTLIYKPVIVIHDFYVPGKDFGYDTWDGHRYDYEFYKPYFDNLYGIDRYDYSYNTDAIGCKRGVIILEPKTYE